MAATLKKVDEVSWQRAWKRSMRFRVIQITIDSKAAFARDDFPYDKLFVICPNVNIQPKYKMLKDICEKIDENIKQDTMKKVNEYNKKYKVDIDPENTEFEPMVEFLEDVPSRLLDRMDEEKMNLIVLDDLVLASKEQQKVIDALHVRGRSALRQDSSSRSL